MKAILAAALALGFGGFAAAADELPTVHWTVGSETRFARVHVPAGAKTRAAPVVFVFHGYNCTVQDTVKQFAIHTKWPEAIVAYMKGLPTDNRGNPAAGGKEMGWPYLPAQDPGGRDVKFFDTALEDLKGKYKVDDKRVYAVGFSNGGGFAFVLWAERGNQLAGVASCAMVAPQKLIPNFSPKPLMLIAGDSDNLQPASKLKKNMADIARSNKSKDDGKPWGGKNSGCTLYPPDDGGAPIVFFEHAGGHEIPKNAGARIAEFFKGNKAADPSKSPLVGDWQLKQPTVGDGTATLHVTEKGGNLEVQEEGNGNAKSTKTTYKAGVLVIHWEVNDDLQGYWEFTLNKEQTEGKGRTVFTRFKDFEPGKAGEIDGKKVRIVEDVSIKRIAE